MRISFNQPAFIPWGGVYARLLHSQQMVLLDDTLLARGFTFVNRNRLKGPEGELWVSVPLKRKGRGRQKIKDLEIFEKERWAKDFLLTLKHFYGKSLYFNPVYSRVEAIVKRQDESFLNLAVGLMNVLRELLQIKQGFIFQSEIGVSGKGTGLLVSCAKELGAEEVVLPYFSRKAVDRELFKKEAIKVSFLRYDPPAYPQFWGDFIKKLSVLDLVLCCGPEGRKVIERGGTFSKGTPLSLEP